MNKKAYTDVIDLFVNNLKVDTDIKRVNFIVYRDSKKSDSIFKTMELDTYLDKTLRTNKMMFNLVDSDYSLCKRGLLSIILNNRNENMSIVVIDIFKDGLSKSRFKRVSEVFKIAKNIKKIAKTIHLINNQVPVYIMGLNNKENSMAKKVINNIYKDAVRRYSNVFYVNNNYSDQTTTSRYNMIMELLNKINDTVVINQTKVMFEKAIKNSLNVMSCEQSIDDVIRHQKAIGVSVLDIKEGMYEYIDYIKEEHKNKKVISLFKERIDAIEKITK